jgi:hypothetical protein
MSQSNTVELPITLPVPIFCRVVFDSSENSSYALAQREEIPTMRVGGLMKVPVRVALAKLAGGDPEILKAMTADFAAKLKHLKGERAA